MISLTRVLVAIGILTTTTLIGAICVSQPSFIVPGDGGDDQERKALERSVALTYAPLLHFHPSECFFPMDAQPFLDRASLLDEAAKLVAGWDHSGIFLGKRGDDNFALDLEDPARPRDYCMDFKDLAAAPVVYTRVDRSDGHLFVQYWFLYYYNKIWAGNHEGDWELVQVVFPKNATLEQIATKEDPVTPQWVAYSQHGHSQVRRYPDEVFTEGRRPKLSVALGSHASSFDAISCAIGISWLTRFWRARFGVTGFDRRAPFAQEPDGEYQLLAIAEHDWHPFAGRWGTISLRKQSAWKNPIDWMGKSNGYCQGPGPRTPVPSKEFIEKGLKLIPPDEILGDAQISR